ncbi:high light inducible protein [Prochlorococcus phage P-RSM4]|uniref:High light inducible protein n=2 Tax=Thaumasvirus stim4 TaxID=2734148 RepID=E3SMA3_9CAUD|nr:high light inducible protein [Prochlorococcus phage P-RSM4]ADO98601.1 high light inducible protein [Prochlorococcus phage P-RSM4]
MGSNARFRSSSWCLRYNWSNHSRYFLMYPSNTKEVEAQKVVAEKLNGRLAMLGIIAGIGAYLTTGQLIPGFV